MHKRQTQRKAGIGLADFSYRDSTASWKAQHAYDIQLNWETGLLHITEQEDGVIAYR